MLCSRISKTRSQIKVQGSLNLGNHSMGTALHPGTRVPGCGGGTFPYFDVLCLSAVKIERRKEGGLI